MSVSPAFLTEVVHFALIEDERKEARSTGFLAGFLAAMHASRAAQARREIARFPQLYASPTRDDMRDPRAPR